MPRALCLPGVCRGLDPTGAASRRSPRVAAAWTPWPASRDGAGLAQAQAELDAIAAVLEREHPDTNRGRGVFVQPLLEELAPPGVKAALRLVLAAGLFVLLIACANVANFMLARAIARRRDDALRLALGAGRACSCCGSRWRRRFSCPWPEPSWGSGHGLGGRGPHARRHAREASVLGAVGPRLADPGLHPRARRGKCGGGQPLPALARGPRRPQPRPEEGARTVAGGSRGRLGQALVVAELGLSPGPRSCARPSWSAASPSALPPTPASTPAGS